MKIALCQINTTLGSFKSNLDLVLNYYKKSIEQGADIVIFPELVLSSYSPLDLLERPDFWKANEDCLKQLMSKTSENPQLLVLGSIQKSQNPLGKPLKNSALVLQKGEVVFSQAKTLLPTYDVFDEHRYFEPSSETRLFSPKNHPSLKIGLSVCEDAWFDQGHYLKDPAIALHGADFVINISASPFELNKHRRRREQISEFSKKVNASVFYVNQVGANDEIIFDGRSAVFSSDGKCIYELPVFEEAFSIFDFDPKNRKIIEASNTSKSEVSEIAYLHKALVVGIRDYFKKTGFKKAVLGLSGGIDSACVAALAVEALGAENVIGVSMPSQYSSSHSLADAEALATKTGIHYLVHSVKFINSSLMMELRPSLQKDATQSSQVSVTEQNIQARLRAVVLTALANKNNALVLTTGNKSELAVGYCTTYGDMAGALAPLGDVYKTKVYQLSHEINRIYNWIPQSTLNKPPSAELAPNQTDEQSLGSYEILDKILELFIEGSQSVEQIIKAGFDAAYVAKIVNLIHGSEFKRRQAAPALKVTSKAFGIGRRIPIAKKFEY